MAHLIHTDIPGYQNFVRMPPAFVYLIEERLYHYIKKSVTNFRKPLGDGLKLAITPRHLATGQTYTSMQYHWLVGRAMICKFIPQVCQASLDKFQEEYVGCPTDPEGWGEVQNQMECPPCFRGNRLEAYCHVVAKKSDSNYTNYKGLFSLVLLALVGAEYRYFLVNMGSSGFSTDF